MPGEDAGRDTDGGSQPADAGGPACDQVPPPVFYRDRDGDGYGGPETSDECPAPAGFVDRPGDCDDGDPERNPNLAERCDGVDNDCDDEVDNRPVDGQFYFADEDEDGLGTVSGSVFGCERPDGYVDDDSDCNDGDPEVGACGPGTFCSHAMVCVPDGGCADPLDCPAAMACDETGHCAPDPTPCGGQSYAAAQVPPNLLIVLDRSCSMRNRIDGVRKWQSAVDAVVQLTQDFAGRIHFGLILFPDTVNPRCEQVDIPVPVGPGNEAVIADLLSAALDNRDPNWPDGPCVTNISAAVEQAASDPGLVDEQRRSYVMLITDGRQMNCGGGADAVTTATLELLSQADVSTFVVGFGGAVSARDLNTFADAGGVPLDGDTRYYQADDGASLDAALRQIGGQALGCVFALQEVPPDVAHLYVFFNNEERVPRDVNHDEGWDYDAQTNQVTLYGDACDRVLSREVQDVDVIFGCSEPN